MATARRVLEPQPIGPSGRELPTRGNGAGGWRRAAAIASVRRAPELAVLIALAGVLNLWSLSSNGWANTYYAAAVRSMASSWHNFLFVSMDPSGVMTVDKPPLSLWIQALSVRAFGFNSLAILVPQALIGIASVLLVYDLVRRRFGRLGGTVAGLALATTPIAVAMSRDNNPDALLTLCCLAAVWFAVRGLEDGRGRWLVLAGVAVGLAFETKMLVALVVVPAIAAGWFWVAPRGRIVAVRQLATGGVAMLAVALAWPLLVTLTPSGERPWISGTSDNSIFSLIFNYNGLGRVTGQSGGPGGGGGGNVFGQGTGVFRLLNTALGGQGGWLLGFAVAGAGVVALASRLRRGDPRSGWLVVVAGSFIVTAALFSFAQGIFHPYYVVLLAPFTAALAGAGVASLARSGRSAAFAAAAVLSLAVVGELAVLHDYGNQLSWIRLAVPFVCAGAAGAMFVVHEARARAWAVGIAAVALLIAPTIWAFDTLGYATNSTFPAGGPALDSTALAGGGFGGRFGGGFGGRFGGPAPVGGGAAPGLFGGGQGGPPAGAAGLPGAPGAGGFAAGGGFGGAGGFGGGGGLGGGGFAFGDGSLTADSAYARTHGGGTVAISSQANAAAAIVSSHADVAGIGGFTGQESDPSVSWLAAEVASGHIRWVDVTGGASTGSGFRAGSTVAMSAVAAACRAVTAVSSTFYDCAGRASALRAQR